MDRSGLKEPSAWVKRFLHLVRAGADVLDVACGSGRHTALFSGAGFQVTAVDRDIGQLGPLADGTGVVAVELDLEGEVGWPFSEQTFGAVVVTNYLHRPLFPALVSALEPGGVLIYETFAVGNEAYGKPSNPNFLLRPGELLAAVEETLTVVAFEHGTVQNPRPAVVQRLCAVNGETPPSLETR